MLDKEIPVKYWTDFRRNPFMWITGEPKIGKNVWIGPFSVIDGAGDLEVGDETIVSAGVHVYTHEMENGVPVRASTKIGKKVYIGANAVILRGCVIEDDSTIGACALVLKNTHIKKGETWAGVPAKKIK